LRTAEKSVEQSTPQIRWERSDFAQTASEIKTMKVTTSLAKALSFTFNASSKTEILSCNAGLRSSLREPIAGRSSETPTKATRAFKQNDRNWFPADLTGRRLA
jgi:hypothetical protein